MFSIEDFILAKINLKNKIMWEEQFVDPPIHYKTRQVYNLFKDLWNEFLGFLTRVLKYYQNSHKWVQRESSSVYLGNLYVETWISNVIERECLFQIHFWDQSHCYYSMKYLRNWWHASHWKSSVQSTHQVRVGSLEIIQVSINIVGAVVFSPGHWMVSIGSDPCVLSSLGALKFHKICRMKCFNVYYWR